MRRNALHGDESCLHRRSNSDTGLQDGESGREEEERKERTHEDLVPDDVGLGRVLADGIQETRSNAEEDGSAEEEVPVSSRLSQSCRQFPSLRSRKGRTHLSSDLTTTNDAEYDTEERGEESYTGLSRRIVPSSLVVATPPCLVSRVQKGSERRAGRTLG